MAELLTFGNLAIVENNNESDIIQFPTQSGNGLGIQKEYRFVEPIRNKVDVKRAIDYLEKKVNDSRNKRPDIYFANRRNLLLFQVGINVGLRVSDLTKLTWGHFLANDMETFLTINNKKEKKTGKLKVIVPNAMIKSAIIEYLNDCEELPKPTDFMFSNSKTGKNISQSTVERCVKDIANELGFFGEYNTHSLRKTYAYHLFMNLEQQGNPLALEIVQHSLNHKNQSTTLRYLGITNENKIKQAESLADYWEM